MRVLVLGSTQSWDQSCRDEVVVDPNAVPLSTVRPRIGDDARARKKRPMYLLHECASYLFAPSPCREFESHPGHGQPAQAKGWPTVDGPKQRLEEMRTPAGSCTP